MAVPDQPRTQLALRVVAVVTVALSVAYGLSIFGLGRPVGGYDTLWDGWLFTIATTLPAVLVVIKARTDRRGRSAWWWIAAGISMNSAANLIYTYHDQNLHPIPYPGPSDVAYLASYVAFAIGLVLFMRADRADSSRAAALDGLVVGLAAGAIAVALWFEPILAQSGSTAQVLVSLAYPLFDVVFIVIVVAGLAPQRYRPTPAAAAFMAGAGVFALGDIVYLNQLATDTYVINTWLELTWVLGILLFGIAPWLASRDRRSDAKELKPALAAIPVVCSIASLGVIALGLNQTVPRLASWLAMASVGAALVRVIYTVRELRRANEGYRQARTDDLTTLMNRRGFAELVDQRLGGADPLSAVLMIDLDGFKEVNDSLGHHSGDLLLAIVGERFARALPSGGVVARLGGDEFGVITSGDRVAATGVARTLIATLANPVALDGIAIRVGASMGIACAPEHGTTRDELLRAADVAMYDAKQSQRDFAVYSASHDPHSRERLALIEDLRSAIEYRAFEMHYQPTIDVATGAIVGMEALIRWRHPQRGLLLPGEFIPLAERVGLIPAITRAVLDQSIAHLAATRAAGHELRLSVNVSASDLVDEELPNYVRSVLDAHDLAPNLLTIEITETALASDPQRAERTLQRLRGAGVRVSIDDFGVGYSSMSQLMQLPVDELKLDRSFVAHIDEDVRAQAILSATIELGRTLGLGVVAEGVETQSALTAVTDRGVDIAQGFFFSPGLPPVDFQRFVEDDVRPADPAAAPPTAIA